MRTWVAALLVAGGCASPQPLASDVRSASVTWKQDVAPLLRTSCDRCHTGDAAAAGYHTDTYLAVITRARAGDAASPLLTTIDPAHADASHTGLAAVYATLKTWVVDDDLGYERSEVHGNGMMNPSAPDFHGQVAHDLGWDLGKCAQCHGNDFSGGKAGASCITCHTGGPTACTTCHGQPPATGAHVAHVTGPTLGRKLDCTECHIKPVVYSDAGHLHEGPGKVTFGALAGPAASYDPTTKTCTGVACHGATFTDTAAVLTTPSWTAGSGAATCGSCHGLPPSGHQNTGDDCAQCHSLVVDDARHFVDPQKHIDGKVELGGGEGCASCHGQPPATGAHLAHAQAQHALGPAVACTECHIVPATVDAPGHIDQQVRVFPSGVSGIATRDAAMPRYDAATGTCSGVYCHGGGATIGTDQSPGLDQTPKWTEGDAALRCGSCHGIPPTGPPHDPSFHLTDCARCHGSTVDATGFIIAGGTHLNGVIDAQVP